MIGQEKVVAAPKAGSRRICMKEVEQHADKESAWFVRDGKVTFEHFPFPNHRRGSCFKAFLHSISLDDSFLFQQSHNRSIRVHNGTYKKLRPTGSLVWVSCCPLKCRQSKVCLSKSVLLKLSQSSSD